jgi:hypothetical protein
MKKSYSNPKEIYMKRPLSLVLMYSFAICAAWSAASPHILRDSEAIVGGYGSCASTRSNNSCAVASNGMSGCTGSFSTCAQTYSCEPMATMGCSGTSQSGCDFDEPQFDCE